MEQQQQAAAGAAGAAAGKTASLAEWKAGASKMTTAAAGEHVAKTAPKAAKAATAPKKSKPKPSARDKPWEERSMEERFGSTPRLVNSNKQLLDVLRYLEAHQARGVISWAEIVEKGIPPWYDTAEGGELYNALSHNARVVASPGGFAYHSEHGIADKASLLAHIRGHPEGVRSNEIRDGYEDVLRDAEALVAEGQLFKFFNAEFKVDVFFPKPHGAAGLAAPADLADAYLKTPLPGDPQELAAAVGKLGLRSALLNSSTLSRKAATLVKQERPKKKRKMQLRHMTNTHLSHMLNAQQYTSID